MSARQRPPGDASALVEYARAGKHTVRVGDVVRVSAAELHAAGVKVRDRGWSGAKLLRFLPHSSGPLAEVTVPGKAGTRTVSADRLTKTRAPRT